MDRSQVVKIDSFCIVFRPAVHNSDRNLDVGVSAKGNVCSSNQELETVTRVSVKVRNFKNNLHTPPPSRPLVA